VLTQASAAVTSGDPSDTIKRFKANHGQLGQDGQISSSDLKALKDSINQLVPLDNAKAGNAQPTGQPTGTLDMAAQNAGIELPFSALVEEGLFGEQDLTEFNKRNTETTSSRDLPFINGRPGTTAQTGTGSTNEPNANAAQNAKNQEAATTQLVNSATGMVPWDSLGEIGALGISPEGLSLGQVLHNTAHTSPTLMHSHAATPHQATQAIAAKLTQYANQKGEQELKIQLDPPELGRVKIVMLVGKDGGIQAQLSFDKPETFLMMQRDSSQLEKSLAEAGIDMSGSSLEFSLSSDNGGDNAGDRHDKDNQYGGASDGGDMDDAQDIDITTTKMDWYKDNSGNIRLDMQA
jgi:flagellar hook-length control protein FliK